MYGEGGGVKAAGGRGWHRVEIAPAEDKKGVAIENAASNVCGRAN